MSIAVTLGSPPVAGQPRAAQCPQCRKAFGAPAGNGAQLLACPHCRTALWVDEQAGMLKVSIAPAEPSVLDLGAAAGAGASLAPDAVDDSLAFLTSSPAPAAPSESRSGSRYRGRKDQQAVIADDCLIRSFDCPQDEGLGSLLAVTMQKLLQKEDALAGVSVGYGPDQWGRKVTVENGIASLVVNPGGIFKKASVGMSAQANVVRDDGRSAQIGASAQMLQGSVSAMRLAVINGCARKLALGTLKHAVGYRHLAADLSRLATTCLVTGILSCIPGVGFLFTLITLIVGLVAWLQNSERPRKIGPRRIIAGLVVGLVGTVGWIIAFASM